MEDPNEVECLSSKSNKEAINENLIKNGTTTNQKLSENSIPQGSLNLPTR